MNLYELTGAALHLQGMLEDGDIDTQTFQDTMESLTFDIEEKADNYARIIKNIASDIDGFKAEEKRLAEHRRALESRVTLLKSNLEQSMIQLDKKSFKTSFFSFNIQKNPAALKIVDEEKIPKMFYIPQPDKLDTAALKEAIKNGDIIEGAVLESGESLRIR